MTLRLVPADLDHPATLALLAAHTAHCSASSPAESCHYLSVDDLTGPDVTLWAAWEGDALAGIGALRALPGAGGEIKTMHTAAAQRGKGVARAILAAILAEADRRGYAGLWLETGTMDEFAAARALYEAHGFTECGPYGDHVLDPNSAYFTKPLKTPEAI